ncbi:MAG: 30S ribosomal protein S17 [Myxococcota bacterium]
MSEAVQETGEAATRSRSIKERRGRVVSAKMQKTVIVMVERRVRHPRYNKFITVRERYSVHDGLGCVDGDIVLIRETRPMSKNKRWRVARKLGHQE